MKKGDETRKPAIRTGDAAFRLSVDGDRIFILADLPGISDEKIRLDLEARTLVISAKDGDTLYRKKISLPWEARLGKKKFRKGILELTLERSET